MNGKRHKLKLENDYKEANLSLKNIQKWNMSQTKKYPSLILNKHCNYCDFHDFCDLGLMLVVISVISELLEGDVRGIKHIYW